MAFKRCEFPSPCGERVVPDLGIQGSGSGPATTVSVPLRGKGCPGRILLNQHIPGDCCFRPLAGKGLSRTPLIWKQYLHKLTNCFRPLAGKGLSRTFRSSLYS